MYQLSQSATGQFVLVDPATDTVVVGDDLREVYERLRATAGAPAAAMPPPAPVPPRTLQWPRLAMIAVLAVLPFVWLGALHLSMGRLVAELRAGGAKPDGAAEEVRTRLERLELRLDQLGATGKVAGKRSRPAPAAVPPANDDTGDEG